MTTAGNFDVTVVIPLYNKASFIRGTLRSVLAQTYPARAIIVVDDQSADDGPAIVRGMADPRIHLVSQPNAGPGPARNVGIAEARSEWVALLDADDEWRPDHLATLAGVASAFPDADLIATGYRQVTAGSGLGKQSAVSTLPRSFDLFTTPPRKSVLWTSCVAVRRTAIARTGGFGAFMPGEDFELWARLALYHSIAVTEHVTAAYVQGTGGLMDEFRRAGDGSVLQPIFATLDAALADPARAHRHPAIRCYRAALLRQTVRQALFRADSSAARKFLASGAIGRSREATLLRLLAILPAPLLRYGLRLRQKARRA